MPNMNDAELLRRLRERHPRSKLPSGIRFSTKDDHLVSMHLEEKATTGSMQVDACAFEAWALICRDLYPERHVRLSWGLRPSPVQKGALSTPDRHYQRFLYRVDKFEEAVAWFEVNQACKASIVHSMVRKHAGELFVNAPGDRDMKPSREPRQAEAVIEHAFVRESASLLGAANAKSPLYRQFPVGLFHRSVNNGKEVFSAKKSAIDLFASSGETAVIFELKVVSNKKVGAISEMLFYAHFVRDIQLGKFKLTATYPDYAAVAAKKKLQCYLLARDWHPCITANTFRLLNEAFAECGYRFGAIRYDANLQCEVVY